jgi:hypothetical protein
MKVYTEPHPLSYFIATTGYGAYQKHWLAVQTLIQLLNFSAATMLGWTLTPAGSEKFLSRNLVQKKISTLQLFVEGRGYAK